MPDYVVFEAYPNFMLASRRAKKLAVLWQEWTSVECVSAGWIVLVPRIVWDVYAARAVEEAADLSDMEYAEFDGGFDGYDEYQKEVILEAIYNDGQGSAHNDERSEDIAKEWQDYQDALIVETGWPYAD